MCHFNERGSGGKKISTMQVQEHVEKALATDAYMATDLKRYFQWVTPKMSGAVTAFTAAITGTGPSKARFNEDMFVAEIMQRINCFTGQTMPPVIARESCLDSLSTEGTFRTRVSQVMRSETSSTTLATINAFHLEDLKRATCAVLPIDFDKIRDECDPLCELDMIDPELTIDPEIMLDVGPKSGSVDHIDQTMQDNTCDYLDCVDYAMLEVDVKLCQASVDEDK